MGPPPSSESLPWYYGAPNVDIIMVSIDIWNSLSLGIERPVET
jgi:hypothetical protein